MDNINNLIKSCIVSSKGGISLPDLEDEYCELVGSKIPYRENGYNCLLDYLRSISGIIMKRNGRGNIILNVQSSKSAHINAMVNKQKNSNRSNKVHLKATDYTVYKDNNPIVSNKKYTFLQLHQNKEIQSKRFNSNDNQSKKQRNEKTFSKLDPPHILGYQLIGDDFLLSLSFKNLGYFINRDEYPYKSGTCISGLTLQNAISYLENVDLPNQVFVMLGSVDILLGRNITQMKNDMMNLLVYLEMRDVHVVVGTLSPLANIFHRPGLVQTLTQFNNWLLEYVITDYAICEIIDLWKLFVDESYHIDFDNYELEATYGTSNNQPLVLWNYRGRTNVEQLLRSQLCSPTLCANRNLCGKRNNVETLCYNCKSSYLKANFNY